MEEDSRSFCFNGIRVCAGSEKMRRGIGKRPCSKGSRLGWITVVGSLAKEDDVHGSVGSVMATQRKKSCERERE